MARWRGSSRVRSSSSISVIAQCAERSTARRSALSHTLPHIHFGGFTAKRRSHDIGPPPKSIVASAACVAPVFQWSKAPRFAFLREASMAILECGPQSIFLLNPRRLGTRSRTRFSNLLVSHPMITREQIVVIRPNHALEQTPIDILSLSRRFCGAAQRHR